MNSDDLARRRARVTRIQAKHPRPPVEVILEVTPSDDPELLGRFSHWLQKLLKSTGTP